MHSAARLGCPPKADNSTLRSARSIFGDVHAAAENDRNLFRGCGRETLRGFFDRQNRREENSSRRYFLSQSPREAAMKAMNSGCGRFGRDLNSGWYCTPTKKRSPLSSTASTSLPSGERPLSVRPFSFSSSR